MNRIILIKIGICFGLILLLAGCETKVQADPASVAPPAVTVEHESDGSVVKVDHPEQFPLATAVERASAPELNVTAPSIRTCRATFL